MKFVSDMIKSAIANGYQPITSGKTITMFKCPVCGEIKMVKFRQPGRADQRVRVHACICGYRKN